MHFRSMNRATGLALAAMAFLAPVLGHGFLRLQDLPGPEGRVSNEPVAVLLRKISAGEVSLTFDPDQGYLPSLLEQLDVPISSQALVFSKSSFQQSLISPSAPRALYFNDDVYVGWVQGGDFIELIGVDPGAGPVFFTLAQQPDGDPRFERHTTACVLCHESLSATTAVSRLLVMSALPDARGFIVRAAPYTTTDRDPLEDRWAGWYVTGTHGEQRHMGNMVLREPRSAIGNIADYVRNMDFGEGANVTDLSARFDTRPYLAEDSDIVVLMVLVHQTYVHNLIAHASREVQVAVEGNADGVTSLLESLGEALVEGMLFVDAAPLTDRVTGSSDFASEFSARGLRDSQGRSLRDLDLERRLLRYPLSYLVYSDAFDAMPAPLHEYVYRRFREVLTGEDGSEDFAHLSSSDRRAIFEILVDAKPDFAAFTVNSSP